VPSSAQPHQPSPPSPGTNSKPVHVVRHRNIKAAIWRNQTAPGPMYGVTITRSYRDEGDKWHDSGSFGFDDLLVVAKLMYDAHSFINAQRSKDYAAAKAGAASEQAAGR
jgi:hypothetical protein